jgi:nitroreductase
MKRGIFMRLMCVMLLLGICFTAEAQTKMSVIEAINARRSVRAYKDKQVDRETLLLIAECGVKAPSALNKQEWEVRIVDTKEWIDGCTAAYLKSTEGTVKAKHKSAPNFKNIFRNAPAVIFVAAPDGMFSGENIGFLGENMMLAATELGLGTCCLGSVQVLLNEPAMAEYLRSLGFSEGYKLRYALAIGYPDETPEETKRDLSKIKFVD